MNFPTESGAGRGGSIPSVGDVAPLDGPAREPEVDLARQVDTAGQVDLPAVIHDYPAAVLLVDTTSSEVVFVNDLAHQLAPDVALPVAVEAWSAAAGLQVVGGGTLTTSDSPLSAVAIGEPLAGRQVSAALASQATTAREALWVIGMPLDRAPEPLRRRSMIVMLPLRFPQAIADAQLAATASAAHRSVLSSDLALSISDPGAPDQPLIWVSSGFERVTGYSREQVLGRNCRFLQGPDTDPAVVARLREGIDQGRSMSETLLNYRQDGTAFYNHLLISPVRDAEGRLTHHVGVQTDVTQRVLADRDRDFALRDASRARQAQAAAEQAGALGRLLLTLSEALTATTTVDDVAATIADVTATELGTTGSGVALPSTGHTHLTFTTTDRLHGAGDTGGDEPWKRTRRDDDAPIALAAREQRAIFHRDVASLRAAHPDALPALTLLPGMQASAYLPMTVTSPAGPELVGVLVLAWDGVRDLDAEEQTALVALARYSAQALQRAALLAERRHAARVLQMSLLTDLPEPDHLEIRARYVPAAVGDHVGGDWYDAIITPDGATTVVIGDVTGHDIAAAARMGQLRGLLRAFAYDRAEPPAAVVSRLERAMPAVGVPGLASLVLARIEQDPDDAADGVRRLRWTNAGHPPPLLLHPDGSTEVLTSDPELLVGYATTSVHTDHTHVLPPGSTLLLYTDGLIEHRGRDLWAGVEVLRAALSSGHDLVLEDLLDRLVADLVGDHPDDDCAILAVRAHP